MIRFLVVGDIHYRGDNPKARIDNYPLAILEKVKEVNYLAAELKVDGVLNPGDLTDSPGIGYSALSHLACELSNCPCPWYVVPGTHDTWDHNINSLYRTPLYFLHKLGVVQIVAWDEFDSNGIESVLMEKGSQVINIGGREYSTQTDSSPEWYSLPTKKDTKDLLTIGLYHGTLLEKPIIEFAKFQLIEDIINPPDITVVCHIHNGFGAICRPDGKWFINPNSLCRKTADLKDINLRVQVALIEINTELPYDNISVKFIPLECAAPGHEVLSRKHLEEQNAKDDRLENFLRLLASEGEQKFMELEDIMSGIAKKENVPEDVVRESLERLGKAREIICGRG